METSIKYGLFTACAYVIAIALIMGTIAGVDALMGGVGLQLYKPLYLAFGAAGLAIAFFAGLAYPWFMRKMVGSGTDRSTDLSGIDTVKLCSLKLLSRYALVLGSLSGVIAAVSFFTCDEDPVLLCSLSPICFTLLYLSYGFRRKFREERRQRFLHVLSR